jgi:hypothetical protein
MCLAVEKLPSDGVLDAGDGVNTIGILLKCGNLGTRSVHVVAEEASVPAESSNSSRFLIFEILSAVCVCIVFIRL